MSDGGAAGPAIGPSNTAAGTPANPWRPDSSPATCRSCDASGTPTRGAVSHVIDPLTGVPTTRAGQGGPSGRYPCISGTLSRGTAGAALDRSTDVPTTRAGRGAPPCRRLGILTQGSVIRVIGVPSQFGELQTSRPSPNRRIKNRRRVWSFTLTRASRRNRSSPGGWRKAPRVGT
jgi:hypothetical protein